MDKLHGATWMNVTMFNDRNKKKIIWLHLHKVQKEAKLNYIIEELHMEKVWKTRKKNKEVITIKSGEVTSRGDEKGCYWQRSQGVVGALGMLALSYPLLWEVITLLFVLFLDLVGWLYLHLFSNYSLNILYVLHLFHNISRLFKWLSKQNTIARFQGSRAVWKGTNFEDFGVSSSWHNVYPRRKVYKCWLN